MIKQYIKIRTLQPVIMTESSATRGGLESLDYITGSSLLGLAASKLYAGLSEEEAWQYFHNGELQFGSAYPVVNGQCSLPTPASLHYEKDQDWHNKYVINDTAHSVHSAEGFIRDETVQYKQCREGFINGLGHVAQVRKIAVTKTALDERQTAADGQLFNYQAIDAGQEFMGCLTGEAALVNKVVSAIEGIQRLGRSRSSEFGKVEISLISAPSTLVSTLDSSTLTLYCHSDLEALDAFGEPTYTPNLGDLLTNASGVLDVGKSFILTRTQSLFNRARGGFDGEQHLIKKGSVLVFNHAEANVASFEMGIGHNTHLGLGQVIANPAWLAKPSLTLPLFDAGIELSEQELDKNISQAPMSPLTKFVDRQFKALDTRLTETETVQLMLGEVVRALFAARSYNHLINAHTAGPTRSQLRRVANVLRDQHSDPIARLFVGDHAVCKTSNDALGWGLSWYDGKRLTNFAELFQNLLTTKEPSTASCRELFIERLCQYELCQYQDLKRLVKEQKLELEPQKAGENNA